MADPELPVVLNYSAFAGMFPELNAIGQPFAAGAFLRAGLLFDNSSANPAAGRGYAHMEGLLYLLTAHIAMLTAPRDANGNPAASGSAPPQVVGRISSASEGSVSVSTEWNGDGSPSEAYYLQTRYGAEYWQATAQYRTWRYRANPTVVFGGRNPLVSSWRGR